MGRKTCPRPCPCWVGPLPRPLCRLPAAQRGRNRPCGRREKIVEVPRVNEDRGEYLSLYCAPLCGAPPLIYPLRLRSHLFHRPHQRWFVVSRHLRPPRHHAGFHVSPRTPVSAAALYNHSSRYPAHSLAAPAAVTLLKSRAYAACRWRRRCAARPPPPPPRRAGCAAKRGAGEGTALPPSQAASCTPPQTCECERVRVRKATREGLGGYRGTSRKGREGK